MHVPFDRYPLPDGAHPMRPWWSREVITWGLTSPPVALNWRWRRSDGLVSRRFEASERAADADALAHLVRLDTKEPLPVPDALCGQVWRGADGFFTITGVDLNGIVFHNNAIVTPWPPEDAVLVYGPGAPWAPPGWSCP